MPLKIRKVPLSIFRGTFNSVAFNRVAKNHRGISRKMPQKIGVFRGISRNASIFFSGAVFEMPRTIFRGISYFLVALFLKCC